MLLLGRVTYESFAGGWPTRSDPDGFADKLNSMPKYVVSSTLAEASWNSSTILRGDVVEEVTALKSAGGGDVLVNGSARLVHALLGAGLVDELRLQVFPVTLGSGLRVFPETETKTVFALAESRSLDSGVVLQAFRPI